MSNLALRVIASLLLIFGATAANAALLRISFSGPVAYPSENWTGPGPSPTSFELSFTVDTLSFTSSSFMYIGSPTGEIQSYRFYGVDVLSVSFIANGSELWSDPAGLLMDFGGDFPSIEPEGGFCFCFFGGTNPLGQSLGSSYDDAIPPRSQLGDDPLATILLAQAMLHMDPIVAGEWGDLRGNGPATISVVPAPPAVWLLGTALAGLGGRQWMRRKAAA